MANKSKDNILLIDVGNSSVKWAQSHSGGISDMLQQQYPENITSKFFKKYWQELDKPNEVIASCVATDLVWNALTMACEELWSLKVQKVTSLKEELGLVNAYKDAQSLGSDRWCAMLGGLQLSNSAFMVIDTGSALTIDVVNDSGQHLGGYIVPGLSMMKNSLGLHTAQVNMEPGTSQLPSLSLANSTMACVDAGIYLSTVKLVEAVFEKECKQCQCFITGGDANLLASLLSLNA